MPNFTVPVTFDTRQTRAVQKYLADYNAQHGTTLTPPQFLAERLVEIADHWKGVYESNLEDDPVAGVDRELMRAAMADPAKLAQLKTIIGQS